MIRKCIISLLIIAGLITISIFLYKGNQNEVKSVKKIEKLEKDRVDLEWELEELENENIEIQNELQVALDSIKKLTTSEIQSKIVQRYSKIVRDTVEIVKEIEKVVIDSIVASNVLIDLEKYDATKLLLQNCNETNQNLSVQLTLVKEQLDISARRSEKFRKQRNLYSIPILGNVLAFPNFVKNL